MNFTVETILEKIISACLYMRNVSNIEHVQNYIEFSNKRGQAFGLCNLIRASIKGVI